jgi:hypothetical protein
MLPTFEVYGAEREQVLRYRFGESSDILIKQNQLSNRARSHQPSPTTANLLVESARRRVGRCGRRR